MGKTISLLTRVSPPVTTRGRSCRSLVSPPKSCATSLQTPNARSILAVDSTIIDLMRSGWWLINGRGKEAVGEEMWHATCESTEWRWGLTTSMPFASPHSLTSVKHPILHSTGGHGSNQTGQWKGKGWAHELSLVGLLRWRQLTNHGPSFSPSARICALTVGLWCWQPLNLFFVILILCSAVNFIHLPVKFFTREFLQSSEQPNPPLILRFSQV